MTTRIFCSLLLVIAVAPIVMAAEDELPAPVQRILDIRKVPHDSLSIHVQDADSGEVLMLAWMNREALELTASEGRAIYWSRSRQALWRKGEESAMRRVGLFVPAQLLWGNDGAVTTNADLTCAFDRMLHLTAYARTLNPKVVVVAGGMEGRVIP